MTISITNWHLVSAGAGKKRKRNREGDIVETRLDMATNCNKYKRRGTRVKQWDMTLKLSYLSP
eukprot:5466152-Amphidinium_carterae.2